MDEDEAYVETVKDDDYVVWERPQPGQEEDGLMQQAYQVVAAFLLTPWAWLLLAFCAYWLYQRFRPDVERWQRRRQEAADIAEMKKNPDLVRSRMEAMDAARRQLQAKYDAAAAEAQERQKEREDQKRQEQLEQLENLAQGRGYRNKVKVEEAEFGNGVAAGGSKAGGGGQAKKKNLFRPEYNPLMGNSSGSSYCRPTPRSRGGGGGG